MFRRLGTIAAALALLVAGAPGVPSYAEHQTAYPKQQADKRPAVIGKRVIGQSVRGRDIVAWHLGEPGKPKVLLISTRHGNEAAR